MLAYIEKISMINLHAFAPSFERNNSQVPLKKQNVLIASRPSHSLVLTQAWDRRPTSTQLQWQNIYLFLRNSHFAAVLRGLASQRGGTVPSSPRLLLFWHSLCL